MTQPPTETIHGIDIETSADSENDAEPVELLVQLAKDGEIDPWDIDIVAVTEKFLAALEKGDLRRTGRALFYASVLLRLKSDRLLNEDPEPDPAPEPQAPGPMEQLPSDHDPIAELEAEMDRRLERKRARGSPETLDALIRELRTAERGSRWKESREYDTDNTGYGEGTISLDYHSDDTDRAPTEPSAQAVTERTHGKDIEATIDTVAQALTNHYDAGRREVLFAEIADAGESRVRTFLAVLFLANRGRLRLRQDQLFGDLWLQDPAAETDTEGATAD